MISAVVLAALFGYVGLTQYAKWREHVAIIELSSEDRQALVIIRNGAIPDKQALFHLYQWQQRTTERIEADQDILLIALVVAASLSGIGFGTMMASRLIAPIREVSQAASAIASGELSTRVSLVQPGSREMSQLIADFNAMALALESYERETRDSSAMIAHELRTPLTVLRGRLQAMLDGVFPLDIKTVAALNRQVELLSRIVEDLSTLSLANIGRLELQTSAFDLAELVDSLVSIIEAMIGPEEIDLILRLEPVYVIADRDRIAQVIMALVHNIIRYARSGAVIEIETYMAKDGARIAVLDRGAGMPGEAKQFAFDRFWRAGPSHITAKSGSGLGLSVVKAIVMMHGGEVAITDRPGGGTCVAISLP